jgi:hypothetical protein
MNIEIRSNADRVKSILVKVTSQIKTKATVRALNHAITKVNTEIGREVRKIYNIKLSAIKKSSTVSKAHMEQANPRASVKFAGRPISLIEFSARPVNPWNVPGRTNRKPGGGVSVQVKVGGSRRTIKHAFIANTGAGYRGVFMRESVHGAPRRTGGEQKYNDPIVNLYSISLPTAIKNQIVIDAVRTVGEQSFESELARQVKLLTKEKN